MEFGKLGLHIKVTDNHTHFIPWSQVHIIHDNMKYRGLPYWQASPMYDLTREQAAFILNNYRKAVDLCN